MTENKQVLKVENCQVRPVQVAVGKGSWGGVLFDLGASRSKVGSFPGVGGAQRVRRL